MKKIGFLGCGKIGQAILAHVKEQRYAEVAFIADPVAVIPGEPVVRFCEEALLEGVDLVIECATADVLKEKIDMILRHSDLLMFSVTAFSDAVFSEKAEQFCEEYGRRIFIPHGAILGLDGIFDGRKVWNEVKIITTKSPKSLGRTDTETSVVYDGPTREACRYYPRNVNVHAAIALAGIGFDRTHSVIISDPAVSTNAHTIVLKGDGIEISMDISSFAAGAVTGAYTPHSACGSVDRILGGMTGQLFV